MENEEYTGSIRANKEYFTRIMEAYGQRYLIENYKEIIDDYKKIEHLLNDEAIYIFSFKLKNKEEGSSYIKETLTAFSIS